MKAEAQQDVTENADHQRFADLEHVIISRVDAHTDEE